MTFELGVYSFGNTPRTDDGRYGPTAQAIRNLIKAVRVAEDVGLDFFGFGEHHTRSMPVSSPTSLVTAAALTTRRSNSARRLRSSPPTSRFASSSSSPRRGDCARSNRCRRGSRIVSHQLKSAARTREAADSTVGGAYWTGEQHLIKTARHWTILRMNYYAESMAEEMQRSLGMNVLTGLGDERVVYASRDDLGGCARGRAR
ncbi:MAG TPA: hypothetical protein VEK79_15820 [Thermoanaerobaculia bacterium]|nr:hypothetical protein [Thermoanaerobaculia bacterium]